MYTNLMRKLLMKSMASNGHCVGGSPSNGHCV